MTLTEITDICEWALDQISVDDRAVILTFVRSLKTIDLISLGSDPTDQKCSICLEKYGIVPETDIPTKLGCGHIMGSECLKKWLITSESCPLCREEVFKRVDQPVNNFRRDILVDILITGREFLRETSSDVNSNESYFAFYRWASEVVNDDPRATSRRIAANCMSTLERLDEYF